MPDRAVEDIAEAIVVQAATDWRALERGVDRAVLNGTVVTRDELRAFFTSEWCGVLCQRADPLAILRELEREAEQEEEGKSELDALETAGEL